MSGNFDRGANRGDNIIDDNLEVDSRNPNIVRAIPPSQGATDETAGNTSPTTRDDEYGDIIEGSDSERTGTSWGLPGRETERVDTPAGAVQEGEGEDEAHPNRNTADRLTRDELSDVGSWSTIDKSDSAGSPTGFS